MAFIEVKELDKQKKLLKASYDMWEKTIKETVDNMKEAKTPDGKAKYTEDEIKDKVQLLRNGQDDIVEKWVFLGGTMEELQSTAEEIKEEETEKKPQKKTVQERIAEAEAKKNNKPKVKKIEKKEEAAEPTIKKKNIPEASTSVIPPKEEANPMASYDVIPLPSKGQCYPNKQGRIAVSYLTAMDENIIVSPNLYRENMVLDIILKEKIRNPEIDPDDLLDGDRDAIILFLRSAAYGNMYSVTTTDPATNKTFDAKIDLSQIKYKDFNLEGDENGWFDFEMPTTKDKIKFKFLSHKDYINLNKLAEIEVEALRKAEIERYNSKLTYYLENDEDITVTEKSNISTAIQTLKSWADKYDEEAVNYSHRATNELEMQIMSVNGNTDREYIHNYVMRMPIKDSTAIRRYIAKNTPGVDYNFEIERPESLGGGSLKVFLQFDQFIFLTDTE